MLRILSNLEQGKIACARIRYWHLGEQSGQFFRKVFAVWLFGISDLVITGEWATICIFQSHLIYHPDDETEAVAAFTFQPRLMVKRCAKPSAGLTHKNMNIYVIHMIYFFVKTLITALIVAAISELARRYSMFAAALASLPLTSILAFVWIYQEGKDNRQIIELSYSIFWLVIPSLAFFLLLPVLMKFGFRFYPALALSCLGMALIYSAYIVVMRWFGIQIS